MKYSKKITEYALLPNKAFPLDARSHFVDVNTAIKAITSDLITTAEEAALVENSYKKYYVGQIITTTNDGTYQVTNNANSFSHPAFEFVANAVAETNTVFLKFS